MERQEDPESAVSAKTIPLKEYSSPQINDFGTVETLSLGGVGTVIEGAAMTAKMKHP